jgi:hypothetical protein
VQGQEGILRVLAPRTLAMIMESPNLQIVANVPPTMHFQLHFTSFELQQAQYPFRHTLMIMATIPYELLSFLFLVILTLQAQTSSSPLHSPSINPSFSKVFSCKESTKLLPESYLQYVLNGNHRVLVS